MFGLNKDQTIDALSQAWVDGQSLRTYRHAPNAGPRKSWAAGDATSRALQLVLLTQKGQIGYPSVLTAPTWGFYDVQFKGNSFSLPREFDSYVMENVLFKISFPAEFHAQTAVEAAVTLHGEIKERLDDIDKILISTHESAIRIISKEGTLNNPADRDHCLQYMTAIGLLKGDLIAEDYEDDVASDPRVDQLREKMVIEEDARYSKEYLESDKRSISNAIQIFFKDGSSTQKIEVEYPIGHRRRREQGIPLLVEKFERNLRTQFSDSRVESILSLCANQDILEQTPVTDFMNLMVAE
jgi:2-methylcitrate dehydratase